MRIAAFFLITTFLYGTSHLQETSRPNRGIQETLLHIEHLGRYRIAVKSPTGTSIELIDTMSGPVASSGEPGKKDGYLDLFLDEGTYKIRSESIKNGKGKLTWVLTPFKRHWIDTPREFETVTASLEDMEECAFWLNIENRRTVRLELMGRHLENARIWFPGDWMDFQMPRKTTREAVPGQPMTHLEFTSTLNPGYYRVSCYGSPGLKWAREDESSPLYIRMGIPVYDVSGKTQFKISPFGRDCFTVSSETNFFQVRTAHQTDLRISRSAFYDKQSRFADEDDWEVMTPKSRSRILTMWGSSGEDQQWFIVAGSPGTDCELRFFREDTYIELPGKGTRFLISSLSSFEADDALDLSAVLSHPDRDHPLYVNYPEVGKDRRLVRKVNISGENELFVYVRDPGTYTIREFNGKNLCEYTLSPFQNDPNEAKVLVAGEKIPLTKGVHTLTFSPRNKGILHFSLEMAEPEHSDTPQPEVAVVDFSTTDIRIPRDGVTRVLRFNEREEVWAGVDIRAIPVHLGRALTLSLRPGQKLSLPITLPGGFDLKTNNPALQYGISALKGGAMPLDADDHGIITGSSITDAGHFSVSNPSEQEQYVTLSLVQELETAPDPAGLMDVVSSMKVLSEGSFYTDFAKKQRKAYLLNVEQAGLFRLETTGRLAMGINVRTRLNTGLFYEKKNGIGRNVMIQEYLKNGTYLLLIDTLGESKGRVGIHLTRQPLEKGNPLKPGSVDKRFFEGGSARSYPVIIDKEGEYTLETLGIDKSFRARLEDPEGWPLLKPAFTGAITRNFRAGTYTYYTLASELESRRITTLKRVEKKENLKGKGPHQLRWGHHEELIWRSGPPDVFVWNLSADLPVDITLSEGMIGTLYLQDNLLQTFHGGSSFKKELSKGAYRLELTRELEDEYSPYSLSINTQTLANGITQIRSRFPVEIPVSLGEDALIDLNSMGKVDIKASLFNDHGLIFQQDDNPPDWNLCWSGRVPAGQYTLKIEKNGRTNGKEVFTLHTKREVRDDTRPLPLSKKTILTDQVLVIPFSVTNSAVYRFFNAQPDSAPLSYAIQIGNQPAEQAHNELWIPLQSGATGTLWVWNTGEGSTELNLKSEIQSLQNVTGTAPRSLAPASLYYFKPGTFSSFKTVHGSNTLKTGGLWNRIMKLGTRILHGGTDGFWITTGDSSVKISPLIIAPGEEIELPLNTSPALIEVAQKKDVPPITLFSIRSSGLSLLGSEAENTAQPYWQALDFTEGETWFATLNSPRKVRIWNGLPDSGTQQVRLKLFQFSQKEKGNATSESENLITIPRGQCFSWTLSPDTKPLTMLLQKGLLMLTGNESHIVSLDTARFENLEIPVSAQARWVRIINTSDQDTRCRITRNMSLNFPEPLNWDAVQGVTWVQTCDSPQKHTLQLTSPLPVYGDEDLPFIFLRSDGMIFNKFPLQPDTSSGKDLSGLLICSSGPGYHRIWPAPPGQEQIYRIHPNKIARTPNAVSPGWNDLSTEASVWTFSMEQAGWILFRSQTDWNMALSDPDQQGQIPMFSIPDTPDHFVYLEKGNYLLHTSALTHPGRWRMVRPAIHPLNEDVPAPDIFLSKDEWQIWSFTVEKERPVGIGLISESQNFSGYLFGPDHNLISDSPFIFQTLGNGHYTFLAGARGAPRVFRPEILGLKEKTTIPEKEIKAYTEVEQ